MNDTHTEVKKKKSIYINCWFWLIVVGFLLFFGSLGSLKPTSDKTTTTTTTSSQSTTSTQESKSDISLAKMNALAKAKMYLATMPFSRDGLVRQLSFDKFDESDAIYGVDNAGADWNEQAVKKAKQYNDITPMSKDGLIRQLVFDKFTQEQAEFGVTSIGL